MYGSQTPMYGSQTPLHDGEFVFGVGFLICKELFCFKAVALLITEVKPPCTNRGAERRASRALGIPPLQIHPRGLWVKEVFLKFLFKLKLF